MRRVRHSRSGLFLIELMICILFFAFTAGICIRFFVKSHDMSTEARNLYQAQQEAASMAEVLESDVDSMDEIFVYYDKDWNQCDKKDKIYWLEVTELPQTATGQNEPAQSETTQNATGQTGTNQDETEQQAETAQDLKKIKIAVYSGKESKKKEIYHLNLSIYCPAYQKISHLSYGEYRASKGEICRHSYGEYQASKINEMIQKGVI